MAKKTSKTTVSPGADAEKEKSTVSGDQLKDGGIKEVIEVEINQMNSIDNEKSISEAKVINEDVGADQKVKEAWSPEETQVTTEHITETHEPAQEEKTPAEPVHVTASEMIWANPNAPIKSIAGVQKHLDKDYIFLNGEWRWIVNGETWEFIKSINPNASEQKNYVSAEDVLPRGENIAI